MGIVDFVVVCLVVVVVRLVVVVVDHLANSVVVLKADI